MEENAQNAEIIKCEMFKSSTFNWKSLFLVEQKNIFNAYIVSKFQNKASKGGLKPSWKVD